ncbi:hypothetical protein FA13DRAFT_1641948 [Coprinellus micaceus]|uniref:Uncharacterized protein n=1 Tax=Coprinellus micaceus TaxID=71717 RepID=A0A4Y7SJK2_COPMI|nr:hypothetical protein FA13DRAFT_1641948 [Coprinellus micaceus]
MAAELHALSFFARLVLFVLCGLTHTHRVVIDILQNAVDAEAPEEKITLERDYDSLLGVCGDILVRDTNLVFRMTSQPGDDLQNNVHILHEWQTDNGAISAPLHAIPNMLFATFKERNSIVMVFPGLYSPNQTHWLNKDKRCKIYEDGIRPAMVKLLGSRSNELPTVLDSEIFRAQQSSGKLSYTTKTFPSWQVQNLGKLIRDSLIQRGHDWALGMVYLHMIRGVKNTSFHAVEGWAADDALKTFFHENHIPLAEARSGQHGRWFIDVGLEISMQRRCLLWRTDKHADVYQELTNVDPQEADRITRMGSSQYVRDFIAHLTGVSGARITPGARGEGPFEVAYCQMYVTDKALTAAKGNGRHAKHITPTDAFQNHRHVDMFFQKLLDLYLNASELNLSSVRVELRVPLAYATTVLLDFDQTRICNCLVAVPAPDYWGWRAWRAAALQLVWSWQFVNGRFESDTAGALLLNQAIPWLANSLHATPDTMSASRDLLKAILPLGPGSRLLANDDIPFPIGLRNVDGTDRYVPKTERGAIFIRRFLVGPRHPVPLFPGSLFLKRAACIALLGNTLEKILEKIAQNRHVIVRHTLRLRNKVRQPELPPPEEGGPPPLDLELPNMNGLSIDDSAPPINLPQSVNEIFRQFFVDVLNIAPNSRNATGGTAMRLTEDERSVATIEVFQEVNLARILNTCRWMRAPEAIWKDVFNKLFPAKGDESTDPRQNYQRCSYYRRWNELAAAADDHAFEVIRESLWSTAFQEIYWLPHAKSDRIWETRDRVKSHRYTQFFPNQEEGVPIPCIIINGRRTPEWNVEG